jgi:UDP-N-acetylglucosamine--N-acetylmuramyl-(pentapeptide) pyrophosphoryl-undecaprenol N-acetylglucosamine transferase
VYAAQRLGIPTVLLEQNAIPGRANRWLSRRASAVCAAFDESRSGFRSRVRVEVTGNPVRAAFLSEARSCVADAETGDGPLLVVLGGSLGAGAINHDVLAGLRESPQVLSGWRILHQTGSDDFARVADEYQRLGIAAEVQPYFDKLAERLKSASLVISRGGGTTLAELACVGLPTIIVPWRGAADDHQLANAIAYSRRGAAVLATDSHKLPRGRRHEQSVERLWTVVAHLAQDAVSRQRLGDTIRSASRPDATQRVLDVLDSVIAGGER